MTEANIKHRTGTDHEIIEWGNKLERLAQEGVRKEIAKHKAAGNPIFYSRKGVLIMELPDGRCFELAQQLREFKQATEEEWTKLH